MGKNLVIKGADFSENALFKTFNYTQLIADVNQDGNWVNVSTNDVASLSAAQGLYMSGVRKTPHIKKHAITDYIQVPTTAKSFRLRTHTLEAIGSGVASLYLVFYSEANANSGIGCYCARNNESTNVSYPVIQDLSLNSEIDITGNIPENTAYIRCAYSDNANKTFQLDLFEERN